MWAHDDCGAVDGAVDRINITVLGVVAGSTGNCSPSDIPSTSGTWDEQPSSHFGVILFLMIVTAVRGCHSEIHPSKLIAAATIA